MMPATTSRVAMHTADDVNERIRRETDKSLEIYRSAGGDAIARRLAELDREWDIERMLEANAASVVLVGMYLSLTVNRKWLLLPIAVGGFLLQHAVQGWCPPLIWLRRIGFRTATEIDYERYGLKALRGDFAGLASVRGETGEVAKVLDAVRQ
jgi:Protein of unknown function (DUF2892)